MAASEVLKRLEEIEAVYHEDAHLVEWLCARLRDALRELEVRHYLRPIPGLEGIPVGNSSGGWDAPEGREREARKLERAKEPGYYWISRDERAPYIAEYYDGLWWACGTEVHARDADVTVLSERLTFER